MERDALEQLEQAGLLPLVPRVRIGERDRRLRRHNDLLNTCVHEARENPREHADPG